VQVSFLSAGDDDFFECIGIESTGHQLKVMLQETTSFQPTGMAACSLALTLK